MTLSDREGDDFFLDAYVIENWIAQVRAKAVTEYRRRPGPWAMQTGQAQCAFIRMFGSASDESLGVLCQNLFRFAEYRDVPARVLAAAVRALSLEQEMSGDFLQERSPDPQARPFEAMALRRVNLERWCDWIDAVVHLETHAQWQLQPEAFGVAEARKRSGGEAAAWPFQEVDENVICLWPLVRRHNWTYADLRNVLRDTLRRPDVHPCRNEQTLSNYCIHALGLHRRGRGQTAVASRPPGYELALRLCPALRVCTRPGLPPWSQTPEAE